MCCRGSDSGSGPVGNWFYPDGTIVLGNSANPNGDITRSSHTQQIHLNRKRPDVMSWPNWSLYLWDQMPHRATITLGEYNKASRFISLQDVHYLYRTHS